MIKNLSKYVIFLIFGVWLTAPTLTLAQIQQQGTSAQIVNNICTRLTNSASKLSQQLMEKEKKITERHTERLNKANARKLDRETKRAERLTQHQERFEKQYEKLLRSAKTDVQKQAVAEFKQTVESARSKKNETLQSAIDSWLQTVQKTLTDRDAAIAKAVSDFKNAVKTASDKAAADCQSGVDPATVRSTLISSLEAARNNFRAERQKLNSLGKTLEDERAKKQQDMKKAVDDYKSAVKEAVAKLQATLSEDNNLLED